MLKEVLVECSGASLIQMELAKALLKACLYSEASTVAANILQTDSQNLEALYIRAEAVYYSGIGDNLTENAIRYLKAALKLDPEHSRSTELLKRIKKVQALKAEGNAAFKVGKCKAAIASYQDVIKVVPGHTLMVATMHSNTAAAFMKQKKWDEGLNECELALKLDSSYQKVLVRRAQCLGELERWEEALNDYESLVQLDQSNESYHRMLREAKAKLKQSKRKDYYGILGVCKDATETEIKKAFKKQAIKCHPDKVSIEEREVAEAKFKELNEAHEVLTNRQARARYDAGHDIDGGDMGFDGGDLNDIFASFFGQQFGGQGSNGFTFHFG